MIAVKYVGHRETYREGAYGSGLVFTKGQTINIEDRELARKMLRHTDVYVQGDETESATVAKAKPKVDDEDQQQDMRDSVANMSKDALSSFAKTHFSVNLDARKSIDNLRTQVVGLIDQFGTE